MRRAHLDISQTAPSEFEVVIALSGELDMSTIDALVDRVESRLERPIQLLTLDLGDLAFMDSTGLRLLIELNDRARQAPWSLKLIFPRHEAAARVLEITGADVALPFDGQNMW
jgi:anti-anti-sigma factor